MQETTHIKNLLRWLDIEVKSAGGDGDAFWITRYHTLEDILPLAEELNKEEWNDWWGFAVNGDVLSLYNGQEAMIITTNEDYEPPGWAQCVVRW